MQQKLIIITGTPSIGKTVTADCLFNMLTNSAHLDGDWLWNVNPFSLNDPRLRNGDKSMSFALTTYLKSKFDYVIFSSCILVEKDIRDNIIADIDYEDYTILGFHLDCSDETLSNRHYGQGCTNEPSFEWLRDPPCPGDIVINTDNKTIEEVGEEIYDVIISQGE